MADLTDTQRTEVRRITGDDESNVAEVDAVKRLSVSLRDDAGDDVGTEANPLHVDGEVSSTPGSVQFVKDTVDTEVNLDTATPANNEPLPVNLYNENGERGKDDNQLKVHDAVNVSAVDDVISLTTTPVELKVGASRLSDRKYIWMQALDSNIKWGFSSGSQSFDIFKNQLLCFPVGDAPVYAKMETGTGDIAFGEGS